ncbi:unnamed protein product [Protopolystoma xenopodis]|uniref:Uncharacterized protein n=1 Tax=Protopolystoma xenopodis TaxID=117903 RepID=A0A3S5C4V0_9PLAT|nr:unnamed protein product [Protopolystoma xenopodis]
MASACRSRKKSSPLLVWDSEVSRARPRLLSKTHFDSSIRLSPDEEEQQVCTLQRAFSQPTLQGDSAGADDGKHQFVFRSGRTQSDDSASVTGFPDPYFTHNSRLLVAVARPVRKSHRHQPYVICADSVWQRKQAINLTRSAIAFRSQFAAISFVFVTPAIPLGPIKSPISQVGSRPLSVLHLRVKRHGTD